MSGIKEIREHIASVKSTQKVTNAMYLIASTKLRRAKDDLAATRPFFDALGVEIARIFRSAPPFESPYLSSSPRSGEDGFLVITAERGLAGAYNQNVIQQTLRLVEQCGACRLFVAGEYGRQYFLNHGVAIERDFRVSAQDPTLPVARAVAADLLARYDRGELSSLSVVYTDYAAGRGMHVRTRRLLPLEREEHPAPQDGESPSHLRFEPSPQAVLARVVPAYVAGFLYSAAVDSFCAEQNARAAAMDAAGRNEEELLDALTSAYNHARQGAITQEITEVSAGARSREETRRKGAQYAHR